MAVKFSDFSVGTIGTDLELVGYDISIPQNVRIAYTDLKDAILADTGVHSYANVAAFPATGEDGVLYVDLSTSFVYYWDGAAYQMVVVPNVINSYANVAAFPATGAAHNVYIDLSTSYLYYWTGSAYARINVPSFILPYANYAAFPATGATGYLYIDLATQFTYYWNGSAYVQTKTASTIVSYANYAAFPATGATGYLYIDLATQYTYYWNGSAYVQTKVVPTINSYATSAGFPAAGAANNLYIDLSTAYIYYWNGSVYVQVLSSIPNLSINRQTSSYTLVLSDANKLVEMNVATANTLTIPLNSSVAFPIGTQITISQYGAGATTIAATSGVTIRSLSGYLKIASQYVGVSLVKIATNEWYCFGNLTV